MDKARAMVQTGLDAMELRAFALPEPAPDSAILKIEAAGVCGSDVRDFLHRPPSFSYIPGHENVGRIVQIGDVAKDFWGLGEGDVVALEEYVVCHQCEWCRQGEYRHCWATDTLQNSNPLRYGRTNVDREPSLWGGFSDYLFMPLGAVWHRVPAHVPPAEASLHIALGNGVQWACLDGGVTRGSSVLVQGPGQMGASCVVASKAAGASTIIVSGLASDEQRLDACLRLGADHALNVEERDLIEAVTDITGGRGVDVAIDTTARAGSAPLLGAIETLRRRGGTIVAQGGGGGKLDDVSMSRLAAKAITLKLARGHSYRAVEEGLAIIGSGRFALELMHTHDFPLEEAGRAIHATAGTLVNGERAVHVAVIP